ncbi:MAG: SprT-like domain-containing protein [Nitrospirota bacterium]
MLHRSKAEHPSPVFEQLCLSFEQSRESLERFLSERTGAPVSLIITDNSSTVLSVKDKGEQVIIRLHRMFLRAGTEVIREIATFVKKRRGKTPLLRAFIAQHRNELKSLKQRTIKCITQGKHYDLLAVFEAINREYFDGGVSASITWGARSPRRAARRRTLGSYSSHSNLIRINPVLDKKTVPSYFIELVIYHEMLHADMAAAGGCDNGKRRIIHSKEFKRRERLFKEYERAIRWEKESF